MRFANPEAFLLLLLLPLYGLWLWRKRHDGEALPFTALSLLDLMRRPLPVAIWLSSLCYLLFYVGLVAALARPQAGREFVTTTQKGIDIMLAVDTSASMMAEDFRPNRLEATKNVIETFISKQEGNRLGVVVFAGQAFTLLPLSTDYGMIKQAVADIHPTMVKEGGTAIGEALASAIYRLDEKKSSSKVIILLTDGEDTSDPVLSIRPLDAAQFAREKDIRVHVIGMGTLHNKVPVPVIDPKTGRKMINPYTGRTAYIMNKNGVPYYTRLDEADLKEIAKRTGGLYFRADNDNKLSAIYEQINQMEKTDFQSRKRTVYAEQMSLFLWPAVGFFLLALVLRQTRAQVLEV